MGARGPWGDGSVKCVKEGVDKVPAFAFSGAGTRITHTKTIRAFAMSAVFRPENKARDTPDGLGIMRVEPRRFEEHHLRCIPDFTHEEDIPLQRDDIACSGDADEFVLELPTEDFAGIVAEDELVDEVIGRKLDSSLEDESDACGRKRVIILVADEIFL